MPYYFSSVGLSFVDCFFEAMSGLTTTGATILGDEIKIDLDGDGHTIDVHQEGTSNYAGLKIYGEGLYKVTYDLKQRGNDTHSGCINIADLGANTTYTYDTNTSSHRNITNHTASATGCLTN